MMGYFKPLRRKIGVVMLLMAVAFTCLWTRSKFATDSAWICFESYQRFILISADGSLCLEIGDPVDEDKTLKPFIAGYGFATSEKTVSASTRFGYDLWTLIGHYRAERFVQVKPAWVANRTIDQPVLYLFFDYWKFAIPLTLLSAYLLFSKPKQRSPSIEQQANA